MRWALITIVLALGALACGEPPPDEEQEQVKITADDVMGIWDADSSTVSGASCTQVDSFDSGSFRLERQNDAAVVVIVCNDAACEDETRLGAAAFTAGDPAELSIRFLQDLPYGGADCALSVDDNPRVYSFESASAGVVSGSVHYFNMGDGCGQLSADEQALNGCSFQHQGSITKR